MRNSFFIWLLVCLPGMTAAAGPSCEAIATIPVGWTKAESSNNTFLSPDKTVTLTIECSVLPRLMTDTEFSAYIGEEEPEEAPPLREFGVFRGRIWIVDLKDREWWLKKEKIMVHLVLKKRDSAVPSDLEWQVSGIVKTLVIQQP